MRIRNDQFQIGRMILLAQISALLIGTPATEAGDPSLPGHHPLTQAQAGSLLISELRWRGVSWRD
jgi:hypothetical protein